MIPSDIESYYKLHSKFYDLTRWAFLFGRNSLPKYFPTLEPGSRVLDLGCGTGKHLNQLKKQYPDSKIYGLDRSDSMLEIVRKKQFNTIKLKHDKYSVSSFPESHFDLIICSYSLTMFDRIEETILNLKTHLKNKGIVLIVDFDTTPFILFRKWIKKNHVSFEPNLFRLLERDFEIEFKKTRKAYFGLYYYSIVLGKL